MREAITTRFGFTSMADDVLRGVELADKRAVVTGGASGIGFDTARVEATRRWAKDGIVANALNPGAIATNLQRHTGGLQTPPERRKSPEQGAATSALLAASPLLEGIGGRYFEDCREAETVARRPTDFSGGVAPYALDAENAGRLWDVALKLLSMS
jgi:NAD(P)-dependent dehydrogenase (short-subunit alcohol dehydrogenase family)